MQEFFCVIFYEVTNFFWSICWFFLLNFLHFYAVSSFVTFVVNYKQNNFEPILANFDLLWFSKHMEKLDLREFFNDILVDVSVQVISLQKSSNEDELFFYYLSNPNKSK